MKKNVIVFGLISGALVSLFMMANVAMCYGNDNYEGSMVIGYAAMLLSLSFVFVGVKNYRDKYNGGVISFGKALRVGLYIAFIASTLYVVTWLVCYYVFIPDFMDKYADHMLKQAQESGLSQTEIDAKTKEMADYKEWYKNPLFVVLLTYMEILPVALLAPLISALILKRRRKNGELRMGS